MSLARNLIENNLGGIEDKNEKYLLLFLLLFLFSSTFSIALTQIFYFTSIFFWVIISIKSKKLNLSSTPFDVYFLLFILSEILATLFSIDIAQSLFYLHKRIIIIPIIYLLYTWLNNRQRLQTAINILFISVLFVSIYGIVDVITNLGSYLHFQRRLNLFSFYMTAGGLTMISSMMLMAFTTHRTTPKLYRMFTGITLFLNSICLLFTFTRGSWLGFIAGSTLISFQRSKIIFGVILFVIVLIIILSPAEFKDRIYSIVDPEHPNNVGRIEMWSTGLKIFMDYPIFGIGDIGTEEIYKVYVPANSEPVGHLHNNFINLLVKLGIVGMTMVILLFLKIFITEYKYTLQNQNDWLTNSINLGSFASFLAFQVNGLFEWNFGDTEVIMFLWITVGLTLAATRVNTLSNSMGLK